MCDFIQAFAERSVSLPEEALEAPGARRGAAHQKHDRETLGDHLQHKEVRINATVFFTVSVGVMFSKFLLSIEYLQ